MNSTLSKIQKLFYLSLLALTFPILGNASTDPSKQTLPSYESYMERLIQLSSKNPHYPFAAMIIDNKSGKILCEGVNDVGPSHNPTHHGEIMAINHCVATHPKIDWSNATLITTAEPCVMCAGAINMAKISKVVYGTSIPYLLKHGWSQTHIRAEYVASKAFEHKGFAVVAGVLHDKTDKLFAVAPYSKHLSK
ncbi:hypothetical protein BH10PSE19_BH10PSE19_02200 [soil metagenome]